MAIAIFIITISMPLSTALALPQPLASGLCRDLKQQGYAVVPNFISPQSAADIRTEILELRKDGRFAAAGVGERSTNRLDEEVRRCEQCFLYPSAKYRGYGNAKTRDMLYTSLDELRDVLHQGAGLPLDPLLTEGLLAHYPDGGFYRRHVDAIPGTVSGLRAWSYLLYLNQDWRPEDGGQLRLHLDGGMEEAPPGASPQFVDVAPTSGTLLVFRSNLPHEVMDTSATRMAVAGWYSQQLQGSSTRRSVIGALAGAVSVGAAVRLGQKLAGGDK